MKLAPFLLATALTGGLLAACSTDSDIDDPVGSTASSGELSGSITVFAASSLTGAFTRIADDFESAHPGTEVVFQFGSSGDLATSITEGADADVFASAATKNMDDVVSAGEAGDPHNFVSNLPEIAVPAGNPKGIATVADLTKPGTKVALCVPTAPCGALAQTILKNAGVSLQPAASPADVKSTLAVIQSGEVDAGIVYVTDVIAAGDKVEGVEIPADINAPTEYPIATLTDSKNSDLADAFVDYVESDAGQQVLTDAGFSAP